MDEKIEMQWYMSVDESATNPTNDYESLTEVKASVMENMVERPAIGKNTNSAPTNLADVAGMKKCLTIMGLLLALFLVVSLAAIGLAAVTYFKSGGQVQGESSQSKGIQSELGMNYGALVNIVSSELQRFLNESATTDNSLTQMLIMRLSMKVDALQANLSQLGELQNAVSRNISSLRSDLVTVRNQVTNLLQTSNTAVNSVQMEVHNLQSIASRNSSTLMAHLDAVDSRVTNLQQTTSSEISELHNAINRNISSLRSDLVTVRNQVTNLQQTSNTEINSVQMEVRNLQSIASRNSSTLMADLNAVNSRVTNLQQTTSSEISDLHNAINRNSSSLRFDLVTVRNQVTNLQQASNTAINSVQTEVRNLQSTASRNSSTLMTDLDAVDSRVTNLQQTTRSEISELHNAIDRNSSSLRSDLVTVRNQVTSLQQSSNTAINSVQMEVRNLQSIASSNSSSIQTQLNTFTTSVNNRLATPINLYQNCHQDTESCTLTHGTGAGAEYYKPYCHTSWLSINVTNYYTLDMRCEFSRERAYWAIEVSSLQKSGTNYVRCKCDLADPSSDGHSQVSLPQTINCILVIVRCRKSQTVVTT